MKSILNKFGRISKPAIIGLVSYTAAAVVTVAVVSIGVATQSTGDNVTGGISGSALGQYGGTSSYASNSGAYSREALEASMAAAEAARRQGDSIYSLRGAASADGFYYGKNAPQQPAGNTGGGANGSSVSDGVEGLRGGSISGMGGGGIAAVDGSNAMDPAASAAQAAALQKAGAAQAAALGAASASSGGAGSGQSGQLRTSQMAGSSGSSGGGSGGSVTLLGTGAESGAGTRAIQQAPAGSLPSQQDIAAFKGGRAGSMGGSNVRGGGQNGGLGAGQEGIGVGNSLYTSYNRTNAARGTVMGDASKGAADAASAFDGSVATEGIPAGDGNVRQGAVSGLSNSNSNLGGMAQQTKDKLDNIDDNVELAKDLKKKIWGKLGLMALTTVGACLSILSSVKAAQNAPYPYAGLLWAAAGVATAGALVAIWQGMGVWGLLKELKDLPYDLDKEHGKMLAWTIVIQSLLTVAVGLSWLSAKGSKAAETLKNPTTTITQLKDQVFNTKVDFKDIINKLLGKRPF
ncbi:MAG: hypothetical protein LBL61_06165 [Elusimicrobiota bacterium]|nr:hypothetical protein [Elusimicrobiota bacterium]